MMATSLLEGEHGAAFDFAGGDGVNGEEAAPSALFNFFGLLAAFTFLAP
eukprot:CAMPEP_0198130348 /NCGR_PEP_ID=MMETSP1442-20131203/53734_1 /TAXON_ID= /ORGANISM="Craspedostauros australis, Strain CCMP3328" /LENGTH=48 /DNA_ID= /DNA_START= /DNA_END= /DNA_ORIENTATION=